MQLRIGGLSDDTANEDLSPLFRNIGTVELITVIREMATGKSKGYAIAWLPDDRAAATAVEKLNGVTVKGSRITVSRVPEIRPGEMEFREWLADNAITVLRKVGLKAGQTVLDFGCGPGIFTIPAAIIAGEMGCVIAVDVRPQPLERVREKAAKAGLTNISPVLAETAELTTGLPDESADAIMVFDMLHTIADKQRLLRELNRVLKTDGVLSVFPMHLGTAKLLEIVAECRIFRVRDRLSLPGHDSPSEVVNLVKVRE